MWDLAALSAVSLVDSINVLLIQAFSALAAGGAIVCAQYIGQKNYEKANMSARQVLFIITAISVAVSAVCLIFQKPLLRLIFGAVEADVMRASETYFFLRHCHSRLLRRMIPRHLFSAPRRTPGGL